MSTYYRPERPLPLQSVKELCPFIQVQVPEDCDDGVEQRFYDGTNYLWFAQNDKGEVIDLFRYGGNDPERILSALEEIFGVRIWSEYDEAYNLFAHNGTPVFTLVFEEEVANA